jgi:hypothetical protein
MGWDIFWAIFSQTHLVTLAKSDDIIKALIQKTITAALILYEMK